MVPVSMSTKKKRCRSIACHEHDCVPPAHQLLRRREKTSGVGKILGELDRNRVHSLFTHSSDLERDYLSSHSKQPPG